MKDKSNPENEGAEGSQHRRLLGKIPEGEFDTGLTPPESADEPSPGPWKAPAPDQHHNNEATEGAQRPAEPRHHGVPAPDEGGEDDVFTLPKGALVGLRRSGGLRFTSREVVVYRDGRVVAKSSGKASPGGSARPRRLSDKDLAALYRAIETADLSGLPHSTGKQSPDGYAYEIAARLGGDDMRAETFDGSIPEQLSPLISVLTRLMKS
ncbi:MAG TPA: hypothetical protein VM409_02375 [Chloroflexia bacterium]|nr:hypothetical protein [Chloroflexia bacterium]